MHAHCGACTWQHASTSCTSPLLLFVSPRIAMSMNTCRCSRSRSAARHVPLPLSPGSLRDMPTEVLRFHLSNLCLVTTGQRGALVQRLRAHLHTAGDATRAPSACDSDPSGPESSGSNSDSPPPEDPEAEESKEDSNHDSDSPPPEDPEAEESKEDSNHDSDSPPPEDPEEGEEDSDRDSKMDPSGIPPSASSPDVEALEPSWERPRTRSHTAVPCGPEPHRHSATSWRRRDGYSLRAPPDSSGDLCHTATSQAHQSRDGWKVSDLASWLEAWNRDICSHLNAHPALTLELVKYQTLVAMLFAHYPAAACLRYDRLFWQAASQDASILWDALREDIYVWSFTRHSSPLPSPPPPPPHPTPLPATQPPGSPFGTALLSSPAWAPPPPNPVHTPHLTTGPHTCHRLSHRLPPLQLRAVHQGRRVPVRPCLLDPRLPRATPRQRVSQAVNMSSSEPPPPYDGLNSRWSCNITTTRPGSPGCYSFRDRPPVISHLGPPQPSTHPTPHHRPPHVPPSQPPAGRSAAATITGSAPGATSASSPMLTGSQAALGHAPAKGVPSSRPELLAAPTPLLRSQFEMELRHHPNKAWVSWLLLGITQGINIGYMGPRELTNTCNLPSAHMHPQVAEAELQKEVQAGWIRGPFHRRLLPALLCSGLGVVPKKANKWHMIQHLSTPAGSSVNDFIPKEAFSLHYSSVDDAVRILITMGPAALMAKADLKSAFRMIPVRPQDWELLGVQWNGTFYFDTYHI